MSTRINLGKALPNLYQAVAGLDKSAASALADAGVESGFSHLIALRVSQINQCAYCVRMHTRDALAAGETTDRIAVLPAWRESGYFSDKERAALEMVEAVTFISDVQFADKAYEKVAVHLSSSEIAAIAWKVIVVNAWNRIAISSRYEVGP
ncbi:carboxymuconolactone decarboxylase family protein [Lysobacter auxotrophicus]|uniref:Carboxymuconolactone decarboxylase family protein n=1 Tax=Lysobacter auxotrophicus TaxID=2992573 RepID=A0ABN6UNY5_9GAMM|nr:carboxymuconolactone decarboxylase family protein [Lysobacter auxotrophicus]BDU18115.1 carboxymuconolactone decarboxylase family protein [Lysobacter auxotrophicus]